MQMQFYIKKLQYKFINCSYEIMKRSNAPEARGNVLETPAGSGTLMSGAVQVQVHVHEMRCDRFPPNQI